MRTERLDIRVPRNAHYHEEWQLNDNVGAPLDLTDCTMELKIRRVAGQGSVIASAYLTLHDLPNGSFTVHIAGSDMAGVAGQSEIVRLAYDLRVTYVDGQLAIPVAGEIILTPGVTY